MSKHTAVWLDRPFTPTTFRENVEKFDRLIGEITSRDDVQPTHDSRRQHTAGATIRYVTSGLCHTDQSRVLIIIIIIIIHFISGNMARKNTNKQKQMPCFYVQLLHATRCNNCMQKLHIKPRHKNYIFNQASVAFDLLNRLHLHCHIWQDD